ncbi:transmembrane protein 109 [Triplophysa rosa]|uniref:Transmembrane protein 109 n=1 Tax=Triplophysa rosa TaxID=992332 RepID=A0A9W8C8R3_TRIRA|nr:transmembrane protein 109 [Triplophysa rosa]KAI7810554.1 transmembrane protein 109 precursor [Triplophysa rosa]
MGQLLYFTTYILSVSYPFLQPCHSLEWDNQSSPLHNVRSIVTSFSEEAHSYLVSMIGENVVDSCLKSARNSVTFLSESAAAGLNVLIRYLSEILEAAGIDVKLPFQQVTPEGVIFVSLWAMVALTAYWIMSLILRLLVGAVRQALWLLKVIFTVAMFGLILSDAGASAETTALRLAGLVCVCVLLGVGGTSGKRDTHLEDKVKMLERRLRDMERSREE